MLTCAAFFSFISLAADCLPSREPPLVVMETVEGPINLALAKDVFLSLKPMGEGPARFYCAASPITNSQYQAAVAAKAIDPPDCLAIWHDPDRHEELEKLVWKDGLCPAGQADCAVLLVSHEEADSYCLWLERKFPRYRFHIPRNHEWLEIAHSKFAYLGKPYSPSDDQFKPRAAAGANAINNTKGFSFAPDSCELVLARNKFGDGRDVSDYGCLEGDGTTAPFFGEIKLGIRGMVNFNRFPNITPATFRVVAIPRD